MANFESPSSPNGAKYLLNKHQHVWRAIVKPGSALDVILDGGGPGGEKLDIRFTVDGKVSPGGGKVIKEVAKGSHRRELTIKPSGYDLVTVEARTKTRRTGLGQKCRLSR